MESDRADASEAAADSQDALPSAETEPGATENMAEDVVEDIAENLPEKDGAEDPRHALGRRGEDVAARFLRKTGHKVLYRNFRPPGGKGEVDIVCRDRDTLIFVEVKTRTNLAFGTPVEAVSREQQQRIARSALYWLKLLNNPQILFRFDVVEVRSETPEGRKLKPTHIKNAFPLPEGWRYGG